MLHFLNERGPQGGNCGNTQICLATLIIGQAIRPHAKDVSHCALLSKAETISLPAHTLLRGQVEGTFRLPNGPTVLRVQSSDFLLKLLLLDLFSL